MSSINCKTSSKCSACKIPKELSSVLAKGGFVTVFGMVGDECVEGKIKLSEVLTEIIEAGNGVTIITDATTGKPVISIDIDNIFTNTGSAKSPISITKNDDGTYSFNLIPDLINCPSSVSAPANANVIICSAGHLRKSNVNDILKGSDTFKAISDKVKSNSEIEQNVTNNSTNITKLTKIIDDNLHTIYARVLEQNSASGNTYNLIQNGTILSDKSFTVTKEFVDLYHSSDAEQLKFSLLGSYTLDGSVTNDCSIRAEITVNNKNSVNHYFTRNINRGTGDAEYGFAAYRYGNPRNPKEDGTDYPIPKVGDKVGWKLTVESITGSNIVLDSYFFRLHCEVIKKI